MRDILISVIVFGSLPFILRNPFFGVMMWTWLGLMNPHRLAWGFSLNFPFAFIVFVTTVMAFAASKEPKKIPVSREIVLLGIFVLWMLITTILAWFPHLAWAQWDKVWRIQLGIVLTLMLTNNRERIHLMVWTICISLGFYGFKGGIWTVLSGGHNRVYGPDGTFIGGNNEIGLALVMTVPLIWYLIMNTKPIGIRNGLYGALGFSMVAIIGTHSRGALVGVFVMGIMFILKSRRKFVPILGAVAFLAILPYIAPAEWFERMETIETYEEDQSAQQRLKAWRAATAIANSSVTGGGYDVLLPTNGTDAHSIYFEILCEQGYPGLAMFLLLSLMTWLKGSRIKKLTRLRPDLSWARDLATMLQTSLVGYATCGAFLGLGYFDLFYLLIALMVVLYKVVSEELVLGTVPAGGAATPVPGVQFGRQSPGQTPLPARLAIDGALDVERMRIGRHRLKH